MKKSLEENKYKNKQNRLPIAYRWFRGWSHAQTAHSLATAQG